MGLKSFVTDVVVGVLTDPKVEPVLETVATNVMAKTVLPAMPAMIGTAIDQAAKHLTDLDNNGQPDVNQIAAAAKSALSGLLPWLRLP